MISGAPSALLVSSPTRNNNNERVGDGRSDRSGNEGQMFAQPASAMGIFALPGNIPALVRAMPLRYRHGRGSPSGNPDAPQIIGDGECEQ